MNNGQCTCRLNHMTSLQIDKMIKVHRCVVWKQKHIFWLFYFCVINLKEAHDEIDGIVSHALIAFMNASIKVSITVHDV